MKIPSRYRNKPAISIRQPYASLIVHGHTAFDTRAWRPPRHLIGSTIVIHASSANRGLVKMHIASEIEAIGAAGPRFDPEKLPFGAIVGTAVLMDVAKVEWFYDTGDARIYWIRKSRPDVIARERLVHGDFSAGRYLWHLAAGVAPHPVPYKGKPRIFYID